MTTIAALFGSAAAGPSAKAAKCVGRSASPIIGGLIVSQLLTLFTTPVIYLYLDRFSLWLKARRAAWLGRPAPA